MPGLRKPSILGRFLGKIWPFEEQTWYHQDKDYWGIGVCRLLSEKGINKNNLAATVLKVLKSLILGGLNFARMEGKEMIFSALKKIRGKISLTKNPCTKPMKLKRIETCKVCRVFS